MRSAARAHVLEPQEERIETTLLELVRAVSETTDDDREVVGTVLHMIRSGHVSLCGIFRDEPVERF